MTKIRKKVIEDNTGGISPVTLAETVYTTPTKTLNAEIAEIKQSIANVGTGGTTGNVPYTTVQGRNLFNKDTTGSPSHFMPVKEKYTYYSDRNTQFFFYDANGLQVGSQVSGKSAQCPIGATQMKINIYGDRTTQVISEGNYRYDVVLPFTEQILSPDWVKQNKIIRSKWYRKKWIAFGDSITTGNGYIDDANNPYADRPYHWLISQTKDIFGEGQAVSGQRANQIVDRLKQINTTSPPDLITIMAGTNDHGFNQLPYSTTDALLDGINWLRTNCPNTAFGIITPPKRYFGEPNGADIGVDYERKNAANATLRQHVDAIIALCNTHNVPCLNIYDSLPFNPFTQLMRDRYYCASDGTHPNDAGQEKIAHMVSEWIENL